MLAPQLKTASPRGSFRVWQLKETRQDQVHFTEKPMIRVIRSIDVEYGNTKILISPTATPPFDGVLIPSVAVASRSSQPTAPLSTPRRTINIRIGGLIYEIGPDARLAQGPARLPNMHDDYCLTPEYLALIRAAMHYVREPVIDLLVPGLLVLTYRTRRIEPEAHDRGPFTKCHSTHGVAA